MQEAETSGHIVICASCDFKLDDRGRCAKCAGVTPEALEALKFGMAYWVICAKHGASEVGPEQRYRREWKEQDPKDRRKKIGHHEWLYNCPKCRFTERTTTECFKEKILLPRHAYQLEIDARMARWNS